MFNDNKPHERIRAGAGVVKGNVTYEFEYNGLGNRIAKKEVKPGLITTTYYVRDAQGNELAVYRYDVSSSNVKTLTLTEHHIFGSSRLGLETKNLVVYSSNYSIMGFIDPFRTNFLSLVGDKRFELSNHLGNVLAVVSDKKIPTATAGVFNADVLSYSDYYPFGSLVPNRHASSNSYRYGFNGKEMDNEIKGEGNSYDYGARMLDPRIGRWFSVDSKAAKFSSETTYGYVSNNPLVFVDPDGDEKIIVIGGGDAEGNDRAKFINAGLRKLNKLIQRSGKEGITLVITDKYLREAYKKQIEKQVKTADSKYKGQVSVVYINNGDELTHYMNSKTTKSQKLSEARKGDPITEVDFFGHGYKPEYSSQGPNIGSFEPAHCDKCGSEQMTDKPSARPDHNKWAWGKNDIDALNKNAFADDGTIDFSGICNAATPSSSELAAGTNINNLATYAASKLSVSTKGWFGRVDYGKIYDTKAQKGIENPYSGTSGIGPAKSNPVGGSTSLQAPSELKSYKITKR